MTSLRKPRTDVPKELKPNRDQLERLLSFGWTGKDIADDFGVDETTAFRWLRNVGLATKGTKGGDAIWDYLLNGQKFEDDQKAVRPERRVWVTSSSR